MPIENSLYSTKTLTGIINNVTPDPRFFLQYFPYEKRHEEEVILFDENDDSLLVTPYAHPKQEAPTIEKAGYKTKMFRPAYLKDKREFNPDEATTRLAGEPLGGSLTNDERHKLNLVAALKSQREIFERRLELQGTESKLTEGIADELTKGIQNPEERAQAKQKVTKLWLGVSRVLVNHLVQNIQVAGTCPPGTQGGPLAHGKIL